jgi:hypothetical protein
MTCRAAAHNDTQAGRSSGRTTPEVSLPTSPAGSSKSESLFSPQHKGSRSGEQLAQQHLPHQRACFHSSTTHAGRAPATQCLLTGCSCPAASFKDNSMSSLSPTPRDQLAEASAAVNNSLRRSRCVCSSAPASPACACVHAVRLLCRCCCLAPAAMLPGHHSNWCHSMSQADDHVSSMPASGITACSHTYPVCHGPCCSPSPPAARFICHPKLHAPLC